MGRGLTTPNPHRDTNTRYLTNFPVPYTSDGEQIMEAVTVDTEDELRPGTYFIEPQET